MLEQRGDLAVNVLDEYVKDFQKRKPTLRYLVTICIRMATPHLHMDFIPYVMGWKGKNGYQSFTETGIKSLGFKGGNKHDTKLNQWINHEKSSGRDCKAVWN